MLLLLTLLMEAHRDNQYSLSAKSGVPQPTIGRIVSGKHAEPRSSTLKRIADGYGVKESNLREEEPLPASYKWPSTPEGRAAQLKAIEHGLCAVADDDLEGSDFASFTRLDDSPAPSMQPILAWNHEDDLPPGEFVMIPRLAVHLSAGNGHEQTEIEFVKKQPQAFRADWIRQKRLKPAKLAAMSASGNSMEPRIWDGDSVVVDTSQTNVVDGKVYALWYDGGERVKRLFRLPGGGLRIRSDNPAFETIELAASEVDHVRILGRVVQISGDGGL